MMAAVSILIWLPVRLVRRSRISNMAAPPRRMLIAARGCRAHRTAIPEGYACLAAPNNPELVQVSHAVTQRPASPYREQRRGNASIPDSEAIGFRARIGQRHGDSADFVTLNAP